MREYLLYGLTVLALVLGVLGLADLHSRYFSD
jgi:hypothetical protein